MTYLLLGLSVPLVCFVLILAMSRYERWMLEARPSQSAHGYAGASLVATLVADHGGGPVRSTAVRRADRDTPMAPHSGLTSPREGSAQAFYP